MRGESLRKTWRHEPPQPRKRPVRETKPRPNRALTGKRIVASISSAHCVLCGAIVPCGKGNDKVR